MARHVVGNQMIETGTLTPEQTAELAKALLAELSESALFDLLEQALTTEQKETLGESWFNLDKEVKNAMGTRLRGQEESHDPECPYRQGGECLCKY